MYTKPMTAETDSVSAVIGFAHEKISSRTGLGWLENRSCPPPSSSQALAGWTKV